MMQGWHKGFGELNAAAEVGEVDLQRILRANKLDHVNAELKKTVQGGCSTWHAACRFLAGGGVGWGHEGRVRTASTKCQERDACLMSMVRGRGCTWHAAGRWAGGRCMLGHSCEVDGMKGRRTGSGRGWW